MCQTTTEYIQVLTFKLTDKNDGIHTVTERKLSQSQVNKVLKYGVYAKSEKWLKQAVLKKDCEALTPPF